MGGGPLPVRQQDIPMHTRRAAAGKRSVHKGLYVLLTPTSATQVHDTQQQQQQQQSSSRSRSRSRNTPQHGHVNKALQCRDHVIRTRMRAHATSPG